MCHILTTHYIKNQMVGAFEKQKKSRLPPALFF